jgi:hypothetical protein
MKMNITKTQYEQLLKLVYMGLWVADVLDEDQEREFYETEQLILSSAKDFGLGGYVEYAEDSREHLFSQEFEETSGVMEYIDAYDDNSFWDELMHRLAYRDVINEIGEDRFSKMSVEERVERQEPYFQKYEKEFQRNGLDNVAVRHLKAAPSKSH